MHFHAIILAALSAGALSVSLTAKHLLNSHSLPNVDCTGEDNGESDFDIDSFLLFARLCPHHMSRGELALRTSLVTQPPSQEKNTDFENIKA